MTATTFYAAESHGIIFAIATTPDGAVAQARLDAKEPDSQFRTRRMTQAAYLEVQENGFDGMHPPRNLWVLDGVWQLVE